MRMIGKNVHKNVNVAQRVRAKAQVRDIAQHIEKHPVMEIIAQVGHTVKMYQVVFAIVDNRYNRTCPS